MIEQKQSHRIGDATVTRIPELLLRSFRTTDLIPDWKPGIADRFDAWMVPDCLDEAHAHVAISTHGWLVQTPRHTVIVDTAVGNDKPRTMKAFDHLHEPFLERLAAVGVAPEQVDHVLLTHLHTDHVGWNTRLVDGRWQPTFPNARYILSQPDLDRVKALVAKEGAASPKAALFFDSIQPVLEAGQAAPIGAAGGSALDGFVYHPTPGHCSGHMSIGFSSGDAYGFFAGDVMHHPIQVAWPNRSSVFSEDHARGRASRLWALDHMAGTDALVFTSHFPGSGAGRVARRGGGFRWTFA
jgi:glyoxylase-like metal-dependent hydrolase (beta-lactamase superfamily II)